MKKILTVIFAATLASSIALAGKKKDLKDKRSGRTTSAKPALEMSFDSPSTLVRKPIDYEEIDSQSISDTFIRMYNLRDLGTARQAFFEATTN